MSREDELSAHRSHLVKLAYRMLGSASDAEEVAQEAFVRWRAAGAPEVRSLRAWLTRAATRLCVDRMRSAARNREEYVGVELPEPLVGEGETEDLDESLSMALLATVQRLGPTERAVFLLRDVFGYGFDEVAEILDLRVDNCRQIAVRARRHLRVDAVRAEASRESIERVTNAFFDAIQSGDVGALARTLSEDVVLRSDGGGKVPAALRPIAGVDDVVDFLVAVLVEPQPSPVRHRRRVWFNGGPGVLVTDAEGEPVTAFQLDVADGRVRGIYAQRNPDKLAAFRG